MPVYTGHGRWTTIRVSERIQDRELMCIWVRKKLEIVGWIKYRVLCTKLWNIPKTSFFTALFDVSIFFSKSNSIFNKLLEYIRPYKRVITTSWKKFWPIWSPLSSEMLLYDSIRLLPAINSHVSHAQRYSYNLIGSNCSSFRFLQSNMRQSSHYSLTHFL